MRIWDNIDNFAHCVKLSAGARRTTIRTSRFLFIWQIFFSFSKWRMALRSCGLNCLHADCCCRLAKPSLHVFSGHFFSSAAAACLLLLFSGARVRWPQSGTYKEICVQKRPTKLKIEIQIGKKHTNLRNIEFTLLFELTRLIWFLKHFHLEFCRILQFFYNLYFFKG